MKECPLGKKIEHNDCDGTCERHFKCYTCGNIHVYQKELDKEAKYRKTLQSGVKHN